VHNSPGGASLQGRRKFPTMSQVPYSIHNFVPKDLRFEPRGINLLLAPAPLHLVMSLLTEQMNHENSLEQI